MILTFADAQIFSQVPTWIYKCSFLCPSVPNHTPCKYSSASGVSDANHSGKRWSGYRRACIYPLVGYEEWSEWTGKLGMLSFLCLHLSGETQESAQYE